MARKSKKVYIFTKKERTEIEDILLNTVKEMQQFLDKHPDPKKFVDKLLSAAESNITIPGQIAKRHSLNVKNEQQISPQDLRKILPQEMQDRKSPKYLKPDQMTYILHQLQEGGYYKTLQESKEIKRPGRPKSVGITSSGKERGGRPSAFTITPDIIKLKRFIANENASQYIQNRLKSIGILQEFFKFIMLFLFYALRKEHNKKGKKETIVDSLIHLLPFFSFSKHVDLASWNVDQILSSDDAQLNSLAEEISHYAVQYPLSFLPFIEAAF